MHKGNDVAALRGASNTEARFWSFGWRSVFTDRDYYFFALELTLPTEPAYAHLLFESSQGGDENRFYEVTVYDESHSLLDVQCKPYYKQSVDHYKDGLVHFEFVCLEALASDAAYDAMRHARFVRLTLTGSYRMIWLDAVRVVLRIVTELGPSPPPDPRPPPAPPRPMAPPDAPGDNALLTCSVHGPTRITVRPACAIQPLIMASPVEEPVGVDWTTR